MDILEFWQPAIDWDRFKQGPVSDEAWDCFKQVVIWCHVFRHWTEDEDAKRRSPPRRLIFPEESAQDFKNRQAQWGRDIEQSVTYQHRAMHLAKGEVAKPSFLDTVAKGTPDTVDGKLYFALKAVMLNGNPSACAFEIFDAEQELQDKPEAVVSHWLKEKGPE
jgi:hypothetical protein